MMTSHQLLILNDHSAYGELGSEGKSTRSNGPYVWMLPSQSVSSDMVPFPTTSPSKTWLPLATPHWLGTIMDQLPSTWLPPGRETARRRLLLADGAGEETKASKTGLNGMLPLVISTGLTTPRSSATKTVAGRPIAIDSPPLQGSGERALRPSPLSYNVFLNSEASGYGASAVTLGSGRSLVLLPSASSSSFMPPVGISGCPEAQKVSNASSRVSQSAKSSPCTSAMASTSQFRPSTRSGRLHLNSTLPLSVIFWPGCSSVEGRLRTTLVQL